MKGEISVFSKVEKPLIPQFCVRCMSKDISTVISKKIDEYVQDKILKSETKYYDKYGREKISFPHGGGGSIETKEEFTYTKRKFLVEFPFCRDCKNIEDIKDKKNKAQSKLGCISFIILASISTTLFLLYGWEGLTFIGSLLISIPISAAIILLLGLILVSKFVPDRGDKSVAFELVGKAQGVKNSEKNIYYNEMVYIFLNYEYATEFIYNNWDIIHIDELFEKKSSVNLIPIIAKKTKGQEYLMHIFKNSENQKVLFSIRQELDEKSLSVLSNDKNLSQWKKELIR